ncbi:FG-GAP-like repeat-containing protein [Streptomyces sp. NRRL S-87]|uniref:FG-GAP-like repeat-containing protein n=1 Tax=Streptomyces sp. NRRL S-87 TaxID=1463920 RepID=UPI0004BE9779|nr:FG-GAP-like repeat-containing protein [Streptomyces sp. NRRL S-87]
MRRDWAALAVAVATVAGSVLVGAGTAAAAPVAHRSDFNGDGYEDFVTSAPAATIGGKAGAGYVAVVPGGPNGLVTAQRKVISQATDGVPGDPGTDDNFGYALATGDFNGDGYDDLAVGAPRDRTGSTTRLSDAPGSVTVLYGSPAGLVKAARAMGVTAGAQTGYAVTAADMDGNGRPEVVASEYRVAGYGGLGRFTVSKGGTALTRTADYATFGVYGLAAGDVDGDGHDDVVAQWASNGLRMFGVFHGGKLSDASVWWPGASGMGGSAAAVGDLDKDGKAEIVLGREDSPWYAAGGDVAIWKGRTGGLTDEPQRVVTQATAGVPGTAEDGDRFGSSVALGDLNGDGHLDLAVGAAGEDTGTAADSGSVTLLTGSATGIVTATGGLVLTQNTTGVPGANETHDQFGQGVALADHTKDGKAELAVSAVGENNTAAAWPYYGDGAVTILRGSATGPAATGAQSLTAAAFGVSPAGQPFGWAFAR